MEKTEITLKVSVIIPVYNADRFVGRAVESAIVQRQTGEVILVEDGSSDGSLEVCRQLASEHEEVFLYSHSDNSNHGAGASRNLGIQKSEEPIIAFLDADDYYLKDRFTEAERILETDSRIDGVYEAIGVHCQDARAKRVWSEKGDGDLTTMKERIPPEDLLSALVHYSSGNFHLDGLVIRKRCLWSSNIFYDELKVHQDTAMIIQLAYYATIVPGRLKEPVAMRRVHDYNRYTAIGNICKTRMQMWNVLLKWSLEEDLSKTMISKIFRNYLYFGYLAFKGKLSKGPFRPGLI
ncbi:MAG: glycosyltransferase, partial [Candidatus Aegiribacteria sp.]|nr:glycosyltransferase [Candidatus Aegiribacteria sp.]